MLCFEGVFPILVTPFDEDENLDLTSFSRAARFMAGLGVDGITILGVLGESNRLLDSEREQLIRAAVSAAGHMPVIVGVSHGGTHASCRLAQMAESLGAGAVMVAPQKGSAPSDERVFASFSRIADAIRIPVVVQDHPASTEVHMPLPLLLRLVNEIPRVACIKEEALPGVDITRPINL